MKKGRLIKENEKWCAGPCGRPLPRTAFHLNGYGYPSGKCKACHRVEARESARRRYRYSAEYRAKERARAAAYYAAHRERRLRYFGRYRLERKLRGVAA